MYNRKKLKDLTLKDNFMFCAVMQDPENCKPMLERTLGLEIGSVVVDQEKSLIYNPDYKGIRMDVLAKDDDNTHYNVEMQVVDEHNLPYRSRYYHGQMDMELLGRGKHYGRLPDCYVIFICDFDPFGKGLCCYTVEHKCAENGERVDDGTYTVILNTRGRNRDGISPELLNFLDFVRADVQEIGKESRDPYIRQLQTSIRKIKTSREMGGRYMLFTELLRDEFENGKKTGYSEGKISILLRILSEKGAVTDQLREKLQQADADTLDNWVKPALDSTDPEEFWRMITK